MSLLLFISMTILAAVAEMKELYKKAVEMQKELSAICSAFNKYAVEGIESIYCIKIVEVE